MDIRLAADGTPYVIDVNPNCDLSDLAGGFSRAAKTGGLSYKDVILRLVSLALARRVDETPIPLAEPPSEPDLEGESESLPSGRGFARAGVRRGGARSP
jgi:D-alanine-D-alanine ligase